MPAHLLSTRSHCLVALTFDVNCASSQFVSVYNTVAKSEDVMTIRLSIMAHYILWGLPTLIFDLFDVKMASRLNYTYYGRPVYQIWTFYRSTS